ncbi:hypothetical protein ACFL0C_01080 [Patescibacteria group bacterium]
MEMIQLFVKGSTRAKQQAGAEMARLTGVEILQRPVGDIADSLMLTTKKPTSATAQDVAEALRKVRNIVSVEINTG